MQIEYIKLDPRATVPRNAYEYDAGWDLFALEDTDVNKYGIVDVRTGIAVAIPEGYYGRIVARSSTWRKRGLGIVEGIIDSGFRGELFCGAFVMRPIGLTEVGRPVPMAVPWVTAGDSIAQLIIQRVPLIEWKEAKALPPSHRGESGFGSSG